MEENKEKHLLTIKSSRISSLKSLFFPMEYNFFEINGRLMVFMITKNWLGQKTTEQESCHFFRAKGFILRKLYFTTNNRYYGRFWSSDVKKAKKLLLQYISKSNQLEWSDTWF
jgi:hypothetical protein